MSSTSSAAVAGAAFLSPQAPFSKRLKMAEEEELESEEEEEWFPLSQTDNHVQKAPISGAPGIEDGPRLICGRTIHDRIHGHIEFEP